MRQQKTLKIQFFSQVKTLKGTVIFDTLAPKWFQNFLWRYKMIWADIGKKQYYSRAKALVDLVFLSATQVGGDALVNGGRSPFVFR